MLPRKSPSPSRRSYTDDDCHDPEAKHTSKFAHLKQVVNGKSLIQYNAGKHVVSIMM